MQRLQTRSFPSIEYTIQNNIYSQVGVSERFVRKWIKIFDEEAELRSSERGKHSKTSSPIVNPDFRERFCTYVRSESRKPGANF